jgi:hypothetical protein
MTRRTKAAARALLAAAKPDRADRGRTMLVPRALVDALRRAVDEDNREAVDASQVVEYGNTHEPTHL